MRLVLALLLAASTPATADDACPADAPVETDPGGGPGPASSPIALAMLAAALLVIGRRVDASSR